jgi:hypothetical protein
MFLDRSRYKDSKTFEKPETGGGFYGIRAREIGDTTAVLEHEVSAGDRLDLLARHYYNDDRMWWRIVDANPEFVFADLMLSEEMAGQVILIPRAKE